MTRNQALKQIEHLGYSWRKAGRSTVELTGGRNITPNFWIGPNAYPRFSDAQDALAAIQTYYNV